MYIIKSTYDRQSEGYTQWWADKGSIDSWEVWESPTEKLTATSDILAVCIDRVTALKIRDALIANDEDENTNCMYLSDGFFNKD